MNKLKKIALTSVFILISIFSLFPFYLMVVMGTYFSEDIFKGIPLLPSNYFLQNLKVGIESGLLISYFNSAYVAVTCTVLSVFVSALTGYTLSIYNFKYKKIIFYSIVITMMIPSHLGLIAYIVQMRAMGLANSHLALIFPWIANSFGVFWIKQYIEDTLPIDVVESGRIDGCSEFRIFLQIVLPYIKPAVVTLCLLIFLWSWNSYLLPLIIINKSSLYTIPLCVTKLGDYYRVDYAARIAALTFGTIPIVLFFGLSSKYFIRGLTGGAIKG